jgi:hypothetical protein
VVIGANWNSGRTWPCTRTRIEEVQENVSVIVPLLVCPDDVDFGCTVVVAEQETKNSITTWRRFGFAQQLNLDKDNVLVDWFAKPTAVEFATTEFKAALRELKSTKNPLWG